MHTTMHEGVNRVSKAFPSGNNTAENETTVGCRTQMMSEPRMLYTSSLRAARFWRLTHRWVQIAINSLIITPSSTMPAGGLLQPCI